MIQRKLRIGDRVQITSAYDVWTNCGKVGQVCYIDDTIYPHIIGVTFKNWYKGHDCVGTAKDSNSGWNYYSTQLELTNKALSDFKEF